MNYEPDLITSALRMLAALAIILAGLLLIFIYTKRKSKSQRGSKEKLIRVLANSYIGVKKYISLVEVPGSILVLGITSDRICLLTKISDDEIPDELKSQHDKAWSSFPDQLYKLSANIKGGKEQN